VNKKAIFISLVLTLNSITAYSQTFNAGHGNFWTGGSFSFLTYGEKSTEYEYSSSRTNMFSLSPIIRAFPANNFFIGPKLAWAGVSSGNMGINMLQLGGEIGLAFNKGTIPYIYSSPHALILYSNLQSSGSMFKLPFNAGIMFPIMNNIGFQIEAGYCIGFPNGSQYRTNSFSAGIGICGFGKNTAISMINVLTLPTFVSNY
jgi:hypothetical protein